MLVSCLRQQVSDNQPQELEYSRVDLGASNEASGVARLARVPLRGVSPHKAGVSTRRVDAARSSHPPRTQIRDGDFVVFVRVNNARTEDEIVQYLQVHWDPR